MQPDAVDIQVDDGLSVGIHKRCHSQVLKTPRSRDMMASARVGGDHHLQYRIIEHFTLSHLFQVESRWNPGIPGIPGRTLPGMMSQPLPAKAIVPGRQESGRNPGELNHFCQDSLCS